MAIPVSLWKKIFAADSDRFSRLHDGQGNIVSFAEVAALPIRVLEHFQAKRGKYSDGPWWPRNAVAAVDAAITSKTCVIEFGSGMSTIWLARRAQRVISVETNPEWAQRTRQALKKADVSNAEVLDRTPETYFDIPEQHIDLVVVDALRRGECVRWALSRIGSAGAIYLDNSDLDRDQGLEGVHNLARQLLLNEAADGKGTVRFFTGYPPANLAPTEGALFVKG